MDRWRILAVDDNQDTLDLIHMTLEEDYEVLTLSKPLETPDILTVFEPDLVVLDVMMPKVSGFKLMEFMKKEKAFKNIPVIFLTAKGAISDQKYGYTLGAQLYLTKPFQPSRLVKNIKLIFEQIEDQTPKKHSLREVKLRLSLLGSKDGDELAEGKEPGPSDGVINKTTWVD